MTTMRLRQSLRRELDATATRARRSVADAGTGLGVWEVARDFSKGQDTEGIRKAFPQLSQAQITAALMYYARYRDEVQAQIDANAALTPEAIEMQYPELVRFAR
ncbi:MAG: DUF433 domain-containing protein [Candidatus Rokubacteria bacterium]|nr:DUF433 domain-containing protein [Candidatus Rokubacteria bacterium]